MWAGDSRVGGLLGAGIGLNMISKDYPVINPGHFIFYISQLQYNNLIIL